MMRPWWQRELIVIMEDAAASERKAMRGGAPEVGMLSEHVARSGGVLRRGFRGASGRERERPELRSHDFRARFEDDAVRPIHDPSAFFRVQAEDERLEELAARIRETPGVAAAYIQPRGQLPVAAPQGLNNMLPSPAAPPQTTPDFTDRQGYLDAAPDGIDARYAWSQPGGTGSGVQIIDIEWSWNLTHDNLIRHDAPLYGGAPRDPTWWDVGVGGRNHGTAVLGVTSATHERFGVKGICPDATVRTVTSIGGMGEGEVIEMAADMLDAGDILILEMHFPGPRFNFTFPYGQLGFIAAEWWPYMLVAIQHAVRRGVVVVEAAGNGSENLDSPLYNVRPSSFPPTWQNPFRRYPVDSGAIMVGAGAPPQGTHGRDYGPARSRLDFSNYGALVDAQGWGREVTTCGYGDLQGGMIEEDRWYTDTFSGTSSATPIMAGALACVQGVRKANGLAPCTPAQLRSLLRQNTGSPQQDGPVDWSTMTITRPKTERIGQLPNLRLLITEALNLP